MTTAASTASVGAVVLVVDAGPDAGRRIAHMLLRNGFRVAVTGRHPAHLVGIVHGHSAERVMAIGADCTDRLQVTEMFRRVQGRFGSPITAVVARCAHHGNVKSPRDFA